MGTCKSVIYEKKKTILSQINRKKYYKIFTAVDKITIKQALQNK